MKRTSFFIASGLFSLCFVILSVFNGWSFITLGLKLILLSFYVIFVSQLMTKKNQEHSNQINELNDQIKKLSLEVQVTSSQISSVSESITVTIDENNEFAKYVYNRVRDMAENNDQVNSSISNTLSEVRNIVELLHNADGITVDMINKSKISKENVKLSLQEILDIVEIINSIHTSSNKTLSNMEILQKTSREIAKILQTVSNISKQTQLLALNATIESARAGENGKGFAVVASEIHKLADDTNKSVDDINNLIRAIQSEVDGVYSVVRESASRVEDGRSASKNIETNLVRIDNSFNEVFYMMDKISVISKEEVEIAQKVGNQIKEVEEVILQTSKSVEDVCISVNQQKNNMEGIASLGNRLNEASGSLANLFSTDVRVFEGLGSDAQEKAQNTILLIKNELCSRPEIIETKNKDTHYSILSNFMQQYPFVEAAWTNDSKGRFICSIPEAGIANANVRDWFKHSICGEEFISTIYISAITRNPCITVSAPFFNSKGEISGVVGIDITIG